MDFWSYSHQAGGNLSFTPHSCSQLSHLLSLYPHRGLRVEETGLWQAVGLQACERNWGQGSLLHTSLVYGSRGSASIWCSGLKGWASGPGTAAAEDRRDLPAQRPPGPECCPLCALLSRLKKLHGPLPGFVEDLLARAPRHPPQTRGQVPPSRSQRTTPGSVLLAPPPLGLSPRSPSPAGVCAAAGLARPRARATAAAGDPAHVSPRLQERGGPEQSRAPIG